MQTILGKENKRMARTPKVTRTIVTTNCNVLCVDVTTGETFYKDVALTRTYKDEKKLMKAVEAVVNTETQKAVHVESTTEVETLYGLDEQKFIEIAEILPPRTAKE